MKKITLLSLALLPAILVAQSQYVFNAPPVNNPVAKPGYTLIFNDDFNSLSLGSGSAYSWQTENPVFSFPADMGKVANTTRTVNLNATGGYLNMVTRKESPAYLQNWVWQASPGNPYSSLYPNESNNGNGYPFDVTTSSIHTNRDYKYGYFEIQAKLPQGPRLWPSFWLFGQRNFSGGCQKNMCEIDCFEIFPTTYGGTYRLGANLHWTDEASCAFLDHSNCIHGWDPSHCPAEPGHQDMAPFVLTDDDLKSSYNTYAVEWTPTEIKFYFNNVCYLTETGVVVTQEIVERMVVILGTGLQYNGTSPWQDMLNTLAPSATFSINYMRIYKKNPVVTAGAGNCKTGTLTYTATTGISGDTYNWSCNIPSAVTNWNVSSTASGSTLSFQLLPAYQNSLVQITVTATGGQPYETSSTTVTGPSLNPEFTVASPVCNVSGISITAMATTSTPGSQWDIFTADANGTITNNTSLQTIFGNSATFNTGLVADNYYVIKHGVWNGSCINWSEVRKTVRAKLSEFSVSTPVCGTNGISITVTALTSTSGSEWQLFPCDINGNITNTNVPQQWGNSITFTNLTPESYYKVKHGVWGNCGTWTESWMQIFIPTFVLNPDFSLSFSGSGNSINYTATSVSNPYSHGNHWTIQNGDANGNAYAQIGSVQWGSSATFSGLNNGSYYVIKHGVWNNCTNWDERRYLVRYSYGNPLRSNGSPVEVIALDNNGDASVPPEVLQLNNAQNDIVVYPNPASGIFQITYPPMSDTEPVLLEVYNVNGQVIRSYKGDIMQLPRQIDLSDQAQGIYLVRFVNSSQTSVARVQLVH
jgi:hypothetical protein